MKNFFKDKKVAIKLSFLVFILIYIILGVNSLPIEEIYPIVGVGYDVDKESKYSVPITTYTYKGEEEIKRINLPGKGYTIGETRDNRQLRMDKAFKLGSERSIVISSEQANSGIRSLLNILFANPDMNDRVQMVVCKDKAIDILNYKIKGYASSAEYIEGMIKNATTFNFLTHEYTLLNGYIRVETEGMNLVTPYIELDSEGITYTGMAIFDKDKMVKVLTGNESKVMNLLREDNVNGILTIQEEGDKYINYKAKAKRKVSCNKKGDKYEFIIDLNLNGDIVVNEVYKHIEKKEAKEIEEKLSKHVEEMCKAFINKMQKELKVDCLQLGSNAVAKYGRDTGVDWNKVICNSDIKVKVKAKLDKVGRGEY